MTDIIGGFILAIVCGLGWYAVKTDMNVQWISYYGMMGGIQAIFGIVRLIDIMVNMPSTIGADILSFVHIVGPLSCLAGAALSYSIYKDYTSQTYGASGG